MGNLLLGLDIGSSSIKASVVDAETGKSLGVSQSPADEMGMISLQPGWAEQDPDTWWQHVVLAVKKCFQNQTVKPANIVAIGISYQMHGLVVVGRDHKPLRSSIIWCDSRAVDIGEKAFRSLGHEYCLQHFLNSPGNFTASKLKWVKDNEPSIFDQIFKAMLPGDYIALRLSGEITTTDSGLSEGIFWDYNTANIADSLLNQYDISKDILATVKPVFSVQGQLRKDAARELGLNSGIKISYRAGDQPNNAFSLNVLNPGETAATAGTSGVIYSVTDKNAFDERSRVNTFIHVNNSKKKISNGVLLCINGTGILNSWLRKTISKDNVRYDYSTMNSLANKVPIGSEGLMIFPFGNGAERVLENRNVKASMHALDFNHHDQSHIFRAAQEGIVFAMRYGFDILKTMGLQTKVIRAGQANMFLSQLFREAFVNTIDVPLQLYNTDGATGAALGAGVGSGVFSLSNAFKGLTVLQEETPSTAKTEQYQVAYSKWKAALEHNLSSL
jgi:xylulokinase